MIPHNMTLYKFICVLYQFHHQTLSIMKINRGQIQFRDYVSTGTEPYKEHFSCEFSKRFDEKPTIYDRMYEPKVEIYRHYIYIWDLDLHT